MFEKVLVANRGEIALRVFRTLRELGMSSVAVYSDADADARHVREADEAIRIGPAAARDSYLDITAVMGAVSRSGADAVHPGYGFLAENPRFARACAAQGVVFIGPSPEAIEAMGDKITAKSRVAAAGVPVVPGRHDVDMTDDDVGIAAAEIGFPVLLKPSGGGGGKGMRVVRAAAELPAAVASARREALSSFGDDALLVEKYLDRPRHIEIQVVADNHGNVVHLGERECSLQRRHQKVVEEAPSAFLTPRLRAAMGEAAVAVARSCGYSGAGTVEFIMDSRAGEQFFFLEMNTRLQVEHPVTEMITGVDLVAWQLSVAAGLPLPLTQSEVRLTGHAVEARVYAEDPASGFLPNAGRLLLVAEPDPRSRVGSLRRVDSAVASGDVVSGDYDPMIAKIVAHGETREEALSALRGMLSRTAYLGVTTNLAFLRRLLDLREVAAADLHTGLIEEHPELAIDGDVPPEAFAAAALERLVALTPEVSGVDPWRRGDGWRAGEPAWAGWRIKPATGPAVDVFARGTPRAAEVRIGDGPGIAASGFVADDCLTVVLGGDHREFRFARDDGTLWLSRGGDTWRMWELDRLEAERTSGVTDDLAPVVSPMPGTVIAIAVKPGDLVAPGDPLVTVEAMKMEHTLSARGEAVVGEVLAVVGQQVAMDARLVVLLPLGEDETRV